jgi:hypothetical protein
VSAFDAWDGLMGGKKPDPVVQATLARIRVAVELSAAIAALEFYKKQGGAEKAIQSLKTIVGQLSGQLVRHQ